MWTWFVVASVELFGSSLWAGIAFFSFLAFILAALVATTTAANAHSSPSSDTNQKDDENKPSSYLTSAVATTGTMERPSRVFGADFTDLEQFSQTPPASNRKSSGVNTLI
jgi:hypothetical protein